MYKYKTEEWMRVNSKELKNRPLKTITLPGTHDSATANLRNEMTRERGEKFQYLNDIPEILIPNLWAAVKNSAQATRVDIETQLKGGVRAFDFRVWPKGNKFYAVHRILGEDYEGIFQQMSRFLDSHPGEAIYAWFRFINAKESDTGIPAQVVFAKFAEMLKRCLGKYAVTKSEVGALSPFDCTYGTLVGYQDESQKPPLKSRVVIRFDDEGVPDGDFYFSGKQLRIQGVATTKFDTDEMFSSQRAEFLKAQQHPDDPFELWLVRTPGDAEVTPIIMEAIVRDIHRLEDPLIIAGLALAPPILALVVAAIEILKSQLQPNAGSITWRSLHDLARSASTKQPPFVYSFRRSSPHVSMVFVDFIFIDTITQCVGGLNNLGVPLHEDTLQPNF